VLSESLVLSSGHYSFNGPVGLGAENFRIGIYLPHFPESSITQQLSGLRPVSAGELEVLARELGNHWRKIINIAAKIGARLQPELAEAVGDIARVPPGQTWQDYRDQSLCQAGSVVALLFSAPLGSEKYHHRRPELDLPNPQEVRVMSGHQYCLQCFPALNFEVIDQDFKLSRSLSVIDSPYFDYRQLSNRKLEKLIVLIQSLLGASTVSNLGAS